MAKPAERVNVTQQQRFLGLDKLRGLLIANMALGHSVAILLGSRSNETWFALSPELLDLTAFFLRLINHSATPFFFVVMGFSMTLLCHARTRKGWSNRRLQVFFVTRGALLIALQFSLVNLGWILAERGIGAPGLNVVEIFVNGGTTRYFGVLWALGLSMILTSLLFRLSSRVIVGVALIVLAAPSIYLSVAHYPLVTTKIPAALAAFAVPGRWPNAFILYTPIPWLSLTLLGLVLGRLFLGSRDRFTGLLVPAGFFALLVFASSVAWKATQSNNMLDALYLQRYPPELLLLIYAIGINFLLLALLQKVDLGALDHALIVFGRSALLFYVSHLFVIAFLMKVASPDRNLAGACSLAVLCLVTLYPACRLHQNVIKPTRQRLIRQATRYVLGRQSQAKPLA